ncbi:hypothetical protein SAMN04488117_104201 [Celeribacter baekdonensis]|nr:hypothetical protein SAMN04488117_104201 [Celeribacter baekdonensis]
MFLTSFQLGANKMMRSISVGKYISVQGLFVGETADGNIQVRVGDKTFEGKPVSVKKVA